MTSADIAQADPSPAEPGSAGCSPQRTLRTLRRLIVICLLGYGFICLAVTLLQSKLIYHPTRGYTSTPAGAGLAFDTLVLETNDGVKITAWYVPHEQPAGTILVCHGIGGNLSDRISTISGLHVMGFNVLAIDYRGFGMSEGSPSEEGTYADADAAWRYLVEVKKEPPERITLFGRSMGGAVAIDLASKRTIRALVTESTFTTLLELGNLHYPWLPIRWMLSYRYDSMAKISGITCPKLFLHGRRDELIPIEHGRRLFEAAGEPKTFIETRGGHTNAGFLSSRKIARKVAEFLHAPLP